MVIHIKRKRTPNKTFSSAEYLNFCWLSYSWGCVYNGWQQTTSSIYLLPTFGCSTSITLDTWRPGSLTRGLHVFSPLIEERKADLKKKIALSFHRVSLSACLWTPHGSEASVKYLCLAVHFIDSGCKIEKRIIKFGIFQSSRTNLDRMIHFKEDCALDSDSGPFNVMWEAI